MRPRLLIPAIAIAAACGDPTPGEGLPSTCEVVKLFPVQAPIRLDILFVISNAPSMADEQAPLVANAPRFMNVLESIGGGLPDVHLGVITADPADGGVLRGLLIDELRYDGSRVRDYDGPLADAFTTLAQVGTSGAPAAQPLEAARLALDPANSANAGFHRDDGHTFLYVVVITDQDDASPAPVTDYATALKALVSDARLAGAGAIAPLDPDGRISTWLSQFPDRHTYTNLLNDDWSDVMNLFDQLLRDARDLVVSPCLDGPLDLTDVDDTAPGLQLACSVSYRFGDGTSEVLPRCALDDAGAPLPTTDVCWWIDVDPLVCPYSVDQLALHIERDTFLYDATLDIRCPCL